MTTLALLSLLSSLVGWILWLRERGRRITAEKAVTDARARLVMGVKHCVLSRVPLRRFSESQP